MRMKPALCKDRPLGIIRSEIVEPIVDLNHMVPKRAQRPNGALITIEETKSELSSADNSFKALSGKHEEEEDEEEEPPMFISAPK